MIYNVNSETRFAYHYTKAATAKTILKNRTLMLGSFQLTNDPRESKSWNFDLAAHSCSLDDVDWGIGQRISDGLKANARVACFCSDSAPLTGDHTRDIFNRGFAKARMWAQYADSHRGACLVFDRNALAQEVSAHFQGGNVLSGLVSYENEGHVPGGRQPEFVIQVDDLVASGTERYIQLHFQRHHRNLFFRKLRDWQNESEWRVVAYSGDPRTCFVPLKKSLVGVMHGSAMTRFDSARLIHLADEPGIEHMRLQWDNRGPWYDLGQSFWDYQDRQVLRRLRQRGRHRYGDRM